MRTAHFTLHNAERKDDFGADVAHDVGPLLYRIAEAELVLFAEDAGDGVFLFSGGAEEEIVGERLARMLRGRALHLGQRFNDVHAIEELLTAAAALLRKHRLARVHLILCGLGSLEDVHPDASAGLAKVGTAIRLGDVALAKGEVELAELELFWLQNSARGDALELGLGNLGARHYSIRSSVSAAEVASAAPESWETKTRTMSPPLS